MADLVLSTDCLAELNSAINAEVHDPDHRKRTHGRPSTRRAGCTGPLCEYGAKAYEREKQRGVRAATKPRPQYVPTLKDLYVQKRLIDYLKHRSPTGYNY